MAKVVNTESGGMNHLRGEDGKTLCGLDHIKGEFEATMECPDCAEIALRAMELVTRAEKRDWRKL